MVKRETSTTNTDPANQVEAEQAAAAQIAEVVAAAEADNAKHTPESVARLMGSPKGTLPAGWAYDGRTNTFFEVGSVEKTASKPIRVTA